MYHMHGSLNSFKVRNFGQTSLNYCVHCMAIEELKLFSLRCGSIALSVLPVDNVYANLHSMIDHCLRHLSCKTELIKLYVFSGQFVTFL